jgi:hypothetical protein
MPAEVIEEKGKAFANAFLDEEMLQQQQRRKGAFHLGSLLTGAAALILLLTGFLINRDPSPRETITLGKDLNCLDGRPFLTQTFDDLMRGRGNNETLQIHQAMIIAASIILPATPLFLNSKTIFNEGKLNALVAHGLGQSASFGSTEIARHFLVAPNWHFFSSCNLSLPECQRLAPGSYALAPDDNDVDDDDEEEDNFSNTTDTTVAAPPTPLPQRASVLCPQPVGEVKDLFNNLHSMPDVYSALIGSSTIIFASNVWFWKLSNKNRKKAASSHDITKIVLISVFLLYVTTSMFFRFKYVDNAFGELIMSFIYGAGIQFFISMLYQHK